MKIHIDELEDALRLEAEPEDVENNAKIKELREVKIMGRVYRWWGYFGK